MSFFRREKNTVDEYSQARKDLARLHTGTEPRPAVDQNGAASGEEELSGTAQESPQSGVTEAADLLETYREGATTVAHDTSFTGTLKSEGNLCIEGLFEGELESSATIFIAETATVEAEVRATDVIVAGEFGGTVNATDRFHATPTARVSGEINSASLIVEQGSRINCSFIMKKRKDSR